MIENYNDGSCGTNRLSDMETNTDIEHVAVFEGGRGVGKTAFLGVKKRYKKSPTTKKIERLKIRIIK